MGMNQLINLAVGTALGCVFSLLVVSVGVAVTGLVELMAGRRPAGMRLLVAGLVFAGLSALAVPLARPLIGLMARLAVGPARVGQAEYDRLRPGMPYDEVVKLLGPGQESSRSESNNYSTVTYVWSNDDGSQIWLTFVNGLLQTKQAFSLSRR